MSSFRLRRAAIGDLTAIVALLADDDLGRTREDPSAPPNPRYVDAFGAIDADPNQLLAVLVEATSLGHEVVIGCLQISFIPGMSRLGLWRGQIESVRIAGSRRGEGLGHVMFEWAIAECRRRECGLVQLTSDKRRPEAIHFYEALGFVASHEGMKLAL
jgi:GNAT superfamily N-acetyltransferase